MIPRKDMFPYKYKPSYSDPDERRYILLSFAAGVIRHREPRKFKNLMSAYEWTFNQKCISREDLDEVSEMIFETVNGLLDIDKEQDRLRPIINGKPPR